MVFLAVETVVETEVEEEVEMVPDVEGMGAKVVVEDADLYQNSNAQQQTNKFAPANPSRAAKLFQDRNAQQLPSKIVALFQDRNAHQFQGK